MRHAVLVSLISLTLGTALASEPAQRTLTFEDRVKAQDAIERVYYSHQIGTTKSFEQAVSRAVLEGKVRRYLDQTAALEVYWKTSVTDEMLQRELERMARGTRMPERLFELYAALGNDPFLIKECLARATLVDRLTRNFYAFDPTLHLEAQRRAEDLHRQLASGQLSPTTDHPYRSVFELAASETTAEARDSDIGVDSRGTGTKPFRQRLSQDEFRVQRRRLPTLIGAVSTIKEEREAFVLSVVLSESPHELRAANYVVPKTSWDDWWAASRILLLGGEPIARGASGRGPLPVPSVSTPVATASDGRSVNGVSCPADDTWDNGSLSNLPTARASHTAVWTGSLMVVWGGRDDNFRFDSGGRYDPATDTWTPMSKTNAPSARSSHTAVWTGSLMVVWGGSAYGSGLNTGGRYDPAIDTWTPTSTTDAPTGRTSHTAVWTGSLMLVWGGSGGSGLNTGGRYDPASDSWTPMATVDAPSGRYLHTAVWTGSLMVVWGGYGEGLYHWTGGKYDPASDGWTPMSTADAPSGRYLHTAVWTGSLMVIWGGGGGAPTNTGGRYDPTTDSWTPMSTTDAPSGRESHSAAWTANLVLVWGGYHNGLLNTGGRYDPATDTWTPISTAGAPTARYQHTAVWTESLMVVWGGNAGGPRAFLYTGGRYDPATDSWTPTSTTGVPTGRYSHTAVWTGSLMVVWGGDDNSGLNTGGRYDPATDSWTPTSTTDAPTARAGHTAVWTGSLMLVWGGSGGSGLNTGGRYDPATDTWTPTSTINAPSARFSHTAVWTGSLMVVWGGSGGSASRLNTGGRYDPATDSWTTTSTTDAPSGRYYHTAVWTGSRMLIFGGSVGGGTGSGFNTGGRYDPASDSWTPMATVDAPSGRYLHTAVWTGSLLVVWGGYGDGLYHWTGGRYDPASDSWTPMSTAEAPSGRYLHTAVWTGSLMVIWGGGGGAPKNTGGRYDPATDTWTPTSTAGAPTGRTSHTAVWSESLMLIWGGWNYGELDTGGLYFAGVPVDDDGDGYSECQGDCNDGNPDIYLGATETCNGNDDNCDGQIDESGNVSCDDHEVCTEDICQGGAGCVNRPLDEDGDGVCDATDQCPDTIVTPTVVIDSCDSGVRNYLFPVGCNFGDEIAACRANATNDDQFVNCVAHVVEAWKNTGLITGKQGSRIVRCAAQ